MERILVVDDEQDLCEILRFNLESEGFGVDTACSAEEALRLLEGGGRYGLLLLDVMMDRMSGLEMVRVLRARGDTTPVVFLTARNAQSDELEGFGVGADDYITKPFAFETVLARVRAVLRRTSAHGAKGGALGVDAGRGVVDIGGEEVELSKREVRLLQLFEAHRGEYLSRQEILAAVWPDGICVGERSVDVHIARLRKKLGTEGGRIVGKTGFGYGLV